MSRRRKTALVAFERDGIIGLQLTQGKIALIDKADWPLVQDYSWRADRHARCFYVATRHRDSGKLVHMHRLIMGAVIGDQIDHINRDGLDNRRANLRLVDWKRNAANQGLAIHSSTQFKGVSRTIDGRFRAYIRVDGVQHSLGTYRDATLAARIYDTAAQYFFGEYACGNFPIEPGVTDDEIARLLSGNQTAA